MKKILTLMMLAGLTAAQAQSFRYYTTTEGKEWQQSKASLSGKAQQAPALVITGKEQGHEFHAWGTCFNELETHSLNDNLIYLWTGFNNNSSWGVQPCC